MQLHEKYSAKGLSVIMLSSQAVSEVKGYAPANKIPFVVAVTDRKGEDAFQVRGYPSSFLIDGRGKIIWSGHPNALQASQVEAALKTVELFKLPAVTKSLASAKAAYEGQKFGDAAKKAKARLGAKSASDQDKADAQMIIDKVNETAAKQLAWVDELLEQRDYLEAITQLKIIAIRFKGTEAEKTAKEREKELTKDPEVKKELSAAKLLQRLIFQADRTRGASAKRKLAPVFDAFARKYEGTKAASRASEKAEELRVSR